MAEQRAKQPSSPAPQDAAKPEDGEGLLGRWSRLKREARERPVEKPRSAPVPDDAQAPELPAPETLTFDSDYGQFFHPKVEEDVRRAALKKLFSDPRFNVMDGLDVYIDDYSKTEPIPAAMLAGLKQAQNILQWAKEDAEARQRKEESRAQGVSQDAGTERAALDPPASAPDIAFDGTAAPDSAPVEPGSTDPSFGRAAASPSSEGGGS